MKTRTWKCVLLVFAVWLVLAIGRQVYIYLDRSTSTTRKQIPDRELPVSAELARAGKVLVERVNLPKTEVVETQNAKQAASAYEAELKLLRSKVENKVNSVSR